MTSLAPKAYLEGKVLSSDPVELIGLLYQGALDAIADARQFLAAGQIAERSRAITKAYEILAELTFSLNHEVGGDLSKRLAGLYEYIQRLLLDANFRQADPPLAEAHQLLTTIAGAWKSVPHLSSLGSGTENAPVAEPEPAPITRVAGPWGNRGGEEAASSRSWSA